MKKKQILWVKILAGLLVVSIFVGSGYLISKRPLAKKTVIQPEIAGFHDILKNKCEFSESDPYGGQIDLSSLPLNIDWEKILPFSLRQQSNKANCSADLERRNFYISISLGDKGGVVIFREDMISSDGPIRPLETIGKSTKLIKKDGGVTIVRLSEFNVLNLIGDRVITISSGENIVVRYDATVSTEKNGFEKTLQEVEAVLSTVSAK